MKRAPHQSEVGYRRDIDGLRALAVGAVCAFHAAPNIVRGGYIGVDVFFVISGFLITGIILRGRDRGTFSFSQFYLRRIRRIFPALIVVMLATLAMGWFLLTPDEYRALGRHLMAASGFGSNFLLLSESGYFDADAATKPLLHLWSLAVEEQFYLLWPATLILMKARGRRLQLGIAAVALISFAINIITVRSHPDAAFYSPVTRFWELLIGALLATTIVAEDSSASPLHRLVPPRFASMRVIASELASLVGLGLIVYAVLRMGRSAPFPGWLAIVPTVGAALVIAAGPAGFLNRVVLGNPVAVFIGLVSYPLYLWHWPLLVFQAGTLGYDVKTIALAKAAALLLAFAASVATYRFVELPIRDWTLPRVVVRLPAGMVGVAALGLLLALTQGVPQRMPAFIRQDPRIGWDREVRLEVCDLTQAERSHADVCVEPRRPLVFLWGDSHAAAFYPGLKSLQARHNFGIAQMTTNGCAPYLVDAPVSMRPDCAEVNRGVLARADSVHPDVFLLHASWKHGGYGDSVDDIVDHLRWTVDTLRRRFPSARIVVLGPVPQWKISLPRSMFLYWLTHREVPPQYMQFMLDEEIARLDSGVAAKVPALGVEYLSVYHALCNAQGCRTANGPQGQDLTAIDYGHLTKSAASFVASQLERQLFPSVIAAR